MVKPQVGHTQGRSEAHGKNHGASETESSLPKHQLFQVIYSVVILGRVIFQAEADDTSFSGLFFARMAVASHMS